MHPITDTQIKENFESGKQDVESLIAPLRDLAAQSETLVLGYGKGQAGIREEMIPYFHVCGTSTPEAPLRALVVGGWVGTETVTPLAIARLLVAMETRLQLVAGIEVTAYPVANLEAHRENVFLLDRQRLQDVRCWEGSTCSHVQVLEKELQRYSYDIVFLLRQHPRAVDIDADAWLSSDKQKIVIRDALKAYAETSPRFEWRTNPVRPSYPRSFTPMPGADHQPAELLIGLPGARSAAEQSGEAIAIILSVLHSIREARQDGML